MKKIKILYVVIIFFSNFIISEEFRCGENKNITYYQDTSELLNESSSLLYEEKKPKRKNQSNNFKNIDEYWLHIGPEKLLNNLSLLLSSFSFITENFEKNSEFEFSFKENGELHAIDFKDCSIEVLKWTHKTKPYNGTYRIYAGFNKPDEYLIIFGLQGSQSNNHYKLNYYKKGIQDCYNNMNPICHKLLASLKIIGYNDLLSNFNYEEQKNVLTLEWQLKRKKMEKEKADKLAKEIEEKEKSENEKRRFAEERLKQKSIIETERIKARKEKEEFDNSLFGQLYNSYSSYMMISDLYDARKEYAVPYISSEKMSEVKTKIKRIENEIISLTELDKNEVWKSAAEGYKKQHSNSMGLIKSTGIFSDSANSLAKLQLITFDRIYNKVFGNKLKEKDF